MGKSAERYAGSNVLDFWRCPAQLNSNKRIIPDCNFSIFRIELAVISLAIVAVLP